MAFGLLMMLTQTLRNRGLDERRRRAMAKCGITRLDDWSALVRALGRGEPPADRRLDQPLPALVQSNRKSMAPLKVLVPIGALGMIMALVGAAMSADAAAIGRAVVNTALVASVAVLSGLRARCLNRLEKALRHRTQGAPRPWTPPRRP